MTRDEFNALCAGLPHATHVVQWGGSDVWKVGGKVFVIGGAEDGVFRASFKVSPIAFEILRDAPGLRGAPYMASRGMTWIQHYGDPGLDDPALADHIRGSYDLIAAALPKRLKAELGIASTPRTIRE
jgi:predicted DNA-binding protein (MmcQ/YjbR family)